MHSALQVIKPNPGSRALAAPVRTNKLLLHCTLLCFGADRLVRNLQGCLLHPLDFAATVC